MGTAVYPFAHHRRWRSGVIFFVINTGGSNVPLCSSSSMAFRRGSLHRQHQGSSEPPLSSPPPTVFWRGFLHQQHWGEQRTVSFISIAEGVPAWSSTSIAPEAATNCLARLHRRRCSGMILFINSSGKQCAPTTISNADGILA